VTSNELREAFARFPSLPFLPGPTIVEPMPRLSELLGGGPRLLIKRDDAIPFGFGGNKPVERPRLLGLDTDSDKGYYYTALTIAVLCLGIIVLTMRSRLGRLLRAYADSPQALLAHGANTRVTSVWVFCISAFIAAIGGVLLAGNTEVAASVSFDFNISLILVAVLAASTLFTLGRRSPILNAIVGSYGWGRLDMVENRRVGIKSRFDHPRLDHVILRPRPEVWRKQCHACGDTRADGLKNSGLRAFVHLTLTSLVRRTLIRQLSVAYILPPDRIRT